MYVATFVVTHMPFFVQIKGLVACTSCWMRKDIHPEGMHKIFDAYANVVEIFNAYVHPNNPYPTADYLHSIVNSGPPVDGKIALKGGNTLSEGTLHLINCFESTNSMLPFPL
jgi:hypothetical protein